MTNLTIAEKQFYGFCSICGLPLLPDGGCKKYHKSVKKEKIGKYSGQSKRFKGGYEND